MEISDRNISREEEIQRLTLVNKFLTVSSKINQPALVDFLGGFENISNYLRQGFQMLNGTVVSGDASPNFIRI